jgi:protoporphyrinogen IX oxidase
MLYLWLKAFHVISAIAWMAALLYLPRLMVYHCGAESGSRQSETFKIMERRLLSVIANPAMAATWIFGVVLLVDGGLYKFAWMNAKLVLVIGLSALHGVNAKWVKEFALDQNKRSARFYRFMNEAPTMLMIGIVLLVVLKPF